MNRKFNVNGDCKPNLHYMVNIESRLNELKKMVDDGDYFTINRARQYGKTTTLKALKHFLAEDYMVVSMDFQTMGAAKFRSENTFALTFAKIFLSELEGKENYIDNAPEVISLFRQILQENGNKIELYELFEGLSNICKNSKKPVVLIIDEVDSAANNQVFLDFLAQLRRYYINRDETATFWSVILAGVYDVKNIQYKIRPDGMHKTNSPWNIREGNEPSESKLSFGDCSWNQMVQTPFDIAADFLVDMSFSARDIAGMLAEYENDFHTGMDIMTISQKIYDYTSGYPFLVSRICKLIDERVAGSKDYPDRKSAWTLEGITEAVKMLLIEKNTLFESLTVKMEDYPELSDLIYALLFNGNTIPYNPLNKVIEMAEMFGLIKNSSGNAVISNRIFETVLYNLFLSKEALSSDIYKAASYEKNQFIKNGRLSMTLVLEKFVVHFNDLYRNLKESFLEEAGRRYFLLYLKPIINGTGNYYIEAQTRDMERTDVIIDYNGEQFVVELKLWRGNAYNKRGEEQLMNYLDYFHLKKGYMLSFNFNQKKQVGVKEIILGEKILIEAVV